MNFTKNFFLMMAASLPLLSCGKDSPSGGSTEPDKPGTDPVEEYIEISVRNTGEKLTDTYDIDYKAHEDAIIVKSNVSWTVASSADWLTLDKGSTVLSTLRTTFNTSGAERDATLTFTSGSGAKLAEILVRQAVSDKFGKADFMDMMLLEYDRSETDYKGYLLYSKDGRVQWLFDAFCPGMGRYNGQPIGEAEGNVHLDKEMTEDILDEYFSDGKWLSRINSIIEGLKPSVPGKFVPKKIVLTIPLIINSNWGELDGKSLHPSNDSDEGRQDRATIANWFVDECVRRFVENDYENLRLIGFYWQEENGKIEPAYGRQIADHIHSYDLNFYWVPWYNAYNNANWDKYGFDKTWLQPNYLFYEDSYKDKSHLYDAYDKASRYGMLLEMEMDNLRSLDRMKDYWDVYEEKGVLDSWPLTYYESGSMLPSRDNIIDPEWKAFHQRVAEDIADRQKKFYGYQ